MFSVSTRVDGISSATNFLIIVIILFFLIKYYFRSSKTLIISLFSQLMADKGIQIEFAVQNFFIGEPFNWADK